MKQKQFSGQFVSKLSLVLFSLSYCSDNDVQMQKENNVPLPIEDAETHAGRWIWLPSEDMRCRDNSTTGIGVRLSNTDQKNLLIYLRGGGACFNASSCEDNAYKYDNNDFQSDVSSMPGGIFNENNTNNPFQEWHKIFVPYCTGDIHIGDLVNASAFLPLLTLEPRSDTVDVKHYTSGLFRGYKNMEVVVKSSASYFKGRGIEKVVLAGSSAGGFGTYVHYDQVATAFSNIPVTGIADEAPVFDTNSIGPDCGATLVKILWQMKFPDDYNDHIQTGDYSQHEIFAIYKYLGKKYPERQFGLLSHTEDDIIRSFYGSLGITGRLVELFKESPSSGPIIADILSPLACMTKNPSAGADVVSTRDTDFDPRIVARTYYSELTALQNSFTAANDTENWKVYFDSDGPTEHTFLSDDTKFYDTTSSDGTHVYTWINSLIENNAQHKTD